MCVKNGSNVHVNCIAHVRKLVTVVEVNLRWFCVRLSILFLVGCCWTLKRSGTLLRVTAHARHLVRAKTGCCVPNISVLNAEKNSLASQVVETSAIARFGQGEKNV